MHKLLLGGAAALCLAGCSPAQQATVSADVQKGCAVYKSAEANPLVRGGVAAGAVAATVATGVPVGAAVAVADAAGNAYCQ